jgi:hypothetical protein
VHQAPAVDMKSLKYCGFSITTISLEDIYNNDVNFWCDVIKNAEKCEIKLCGNRAK